MMRGLSGENIHPFIQSSIHASVRMTVTVASAKTVKMRHIECDGSAADRYSFMTEHDEMKLSRETAHKRYMNTSQTTMSVHLYHVSSQLLFSFSKVTHTKQDFCLLLSFLSASDSFSTEPTPPRVRKVCNESRLQWEVEVCGEGFKEDMTHIDPQNWCNLTHFIRYHRI